MVWSLLVLAAWCSVSVRSVSGDNLPPVRTRMTKDPYTLYGPYHYAIAEEETNRGFFATNFEITRRLAKKFTDFPTQYLLLPAAYKSFNGNCPQMNLVDIPEMVSVMDALREYDAVAEGKCHTESPLDESTHNGQRNCQYGLVRSKLGEALFNAFITAESMIMEANLKTRLYYAKHNEDYGKAFIKFAKHQYLIKEVTKTCALLFENGTVSVVYGIGEILKGLPSLLNSTESEFTSKVLKDCDKLCSIFSTMIMEIIKFNRAFPIIESDKTETYFEIFCGYLNSSSWHNPNSTYSNRLSVYWDLKSMEIIVSRLLSMVINDSDWQAKVEDGHQRIIDALEKSDLKTAVEVGIRLIQEVNTVAEPSSHKVNAIEEYLLCVLMSIVEIIGNRSPAIGLLERVVGFFYMPEDSVELVNYVYTHTDFLLGLYSMKEVPGKMQNVLGTLQPMLKDYVNREVLKVVQMKEDTEKSAVEKAFELAMSKQS